MKASLLTKLVVLFLILILISGLVFGAGCRKAEPQRPVTTQVPGTTQLSSTLVPNVPMDVYVYCKQDSPTRIPINANDPGTIVNVESLAVWGVPAQDGFAFGIALTMTNTGDASRIYSQIRVNPELWKSLSGKVIYLVQGSGSAAEALKSAITRNDFKNYDDEKGLAAAVSLPAGGETKLGAIAIAKPSNELLGLISKMTGAQNMGMINTALGLAKLDVVAAGLYSSQQIDGVNMLKAVRGGIQDVRDLGLGMLILAKSGLPGFVVAPAVSQLLKQYNFVETKIGNAIVYKLYSPAGGLGLTVLVRIEGSSIFAAASTRESYAQTLITSIK